MRLIGLIVVRNHQTLDYMPLEAARSLIPFCDRVIISDMESDDGSYQELKEFESTDSRIWVVQQPWSRPHNDPEWWVKALNYARTTFVPQNSFLLQLDADEVLGPESRDGIRDALNEPERGALFKRLNFWKDAHHLSPENRVCGTMVARMGPANLYLPSDEPNPAMRPNLRDRAQDYPGLTIYHYGFLRDPQAFIRKSITVQRAFFGSIDSRLTSVPEGKAWDEVDYFDGEPLRPYFGNHPAEAIQWLKDRGRL